MRKRKIRISRTIVLISVISIPIEINSITKCINEQLVSDRNVTKLCN